MTTTKLTDTTLTRRINHAVKARKWGMALKYAEMALTDGRTLPHIRWDVPVPTLKDRLVALLPTD